MSKLKKGLIILFLITIVAVLIWRVYEIEKYEVLNSEYERINIDELDGSDFNISYSIEDSIKIALYTRTEIESYQENNVFAVVEYIEKSPWKKIWHSNDLVKFAVKDGDEYIYQEEMTAANRTSILKMNDVLIIKFSNELLFDFIKNRKSDKLIFEAYPNFHTQQKHFDFIVPTPMEFVD